VEAVEAGVDVLQRDDAGEQFFHRQLPRAEQLDEARDARDA